VKVLRREQVPVVKPHISRPTNPEKAPALSLPVLPSAAKHRIERASSDKYPGAIAEAAKLSPAHIPAFEMPIIAEATRQIDTSVSQLQQLETRNIQFRQPAEVFDEAVYAERYLEPSDSLTDMESARSADVFISDTEHYIPRPDSTSEYIDHEIIDSLFTTSSIADYEADLDLDNTLAADAAAEPDYGDVSDSELLVSQNLSPTFEETADIEAVEQDPMIETLQPVAAYILHVVESLPDDSGEVSPLSDQDSEEVEGLSALSIIAEPNIVEPIAENTPDEQVEAILAVASMEESDYSEASETEETVPEKLETILQLEDHIIHAENDNNIGLASELSGLSTAIEQTILHISEALSNTNGPTAHESELTEIAPEFREYLERACRRLLICLDRDSSDASVVLLMQELLRPSDPTTLSLNPLIGEIGTREHKLFNLDGLKTLTNQSTPDWFQILGKLAVAPAAA